jgi:hypothetical protein
VIQKERSIFLELKVLVTARKNSHEHVSNEIELFESGNKKKPL